MTSTTSKLHELRSHQEKQAQLEREALAEIPKFWACGRCGFENHPRNYGDPFRCEQCGAHVGDRGHVVRS